MKCERCKAEVKPTDICVLDAGDVQHRLCPSCYESAFQLLPPDPERHFWGQDWQGWRDLLGSVNAADPGAVCACGKPAVDVVKNKPVCDECLQAKLKLPYEQV